MDVRRDDFFKRRTWKRRVFIMSSSCKGTRSLVANSKHKPSVTSKAIFVRYAVLRWWRAIGTILTRYRDVAQVTNRVNNKGDRKKYCAEGRMDPSSSRGAWSTVPSKIWLNWSCFHAAVPYSNIKARRSSNSLGSPRQFDITCSYWRFPAKTSMI